MTYEEIVNYYVNLLIKQFYDKPKARATIYAVVRQLIADQLPLAIQNGFDIETSVGKQLDILGKYIGGSRRIQGQIIAYGYFNFTSYNGVGFDLFGFGDYVTPQTGQHPFLSYQDAQLSVYDLNDNDYRSVLKFLIIANNSRSSTKLITEAVYNYFGNDILVVDNKDMTMTVLFKTSIDFLLRTLLKKDWFPRPAAVAINAFSLPSINNIFSFRTYAAQQGNAGTFNTYDDYRLDMPWLQYANEIIV
jgi:hypothetical protein